MNFLASSVFTLSSLAYAPNLRSQIWVQPSVHKHNFRNPCTVTTMCAVPDPSVSAAAQPPSEESGDGTPSISPRTILKIAVALALAATVQPMLVAKVVYVASGVGLGYAGTKLLRFAGSPEAREKIAVFGAGVLAFLNKINPRERLRAFLLRMDPSLEERQDQTIGWRDLRGPFRSKKKPKRGPFGSNKKPQRRGGAEPQMSAVDGVHAARRALALAAVTSVSQASAADEVLQSAAGAGAEEWKKWTFLGVMLLSVLHPLLPTPKDIFGSD